MSAASSLVWVQHSMESCSRRKARLALDPRRLGVLHWAAWLVWEWRILLNVRPTAAQLQPSLRRGAA